MKVNTLAPIGLSAYSRLSHLKRTVTALRNNTLSDRSDLYIFSDAPRKHDTLKVAEVRKYIHSIDGFKNIEIIERKNNNRVNNNRNGIGYLLNKYGKIIFLEEDIITAPGFLTYMNRALKYFQHNQNVFSIAGYSPPIKANIYCTEDIYFLPRFNAWGFGIWKNRYDSIRYFKLSELNIKILKNRKNRKFVSNALGDDALLMFLYDAEKIIDALDVKAMFQQVLNKTFTVYPKFSLSQNIGHDGSGLHCNQTDKYKTDIWNKTEFVFTEKVILNNNIAKAHSNFRRLDRKSKLLYLLKRYHIYPVIKTIKSLRLKN